MISHYSSKTPANLFKASSILDSMHVLKTNFNGTPNVGLYIYATNDYIIMGEHVQEKLLAEVNMTLGDVPVHHIKIAGTSMPGIFLAGNSKAVLVPSLAFDWEIKALEQAGVPVKILKTRQTCLGNNIVCNDHGAIISPDFTEEERKDIEKLLGVPAIKMEIAGLASPGALVVLNNKHGIIHRDASTQEIKQIEGLLRVKLEAATINLGTPYLRAGIVNNKFGFVIGDASGGPEIVHIEESLGYLDDEEDDTTTRSTHHAKNK